MADEFIGLSNIGRSRSTATSGRDIPTGEQPGWSPPVADAVFGADESYLGPMGSLGDISAQNSYAAQLPEKSQLGSKAGDPLLGAAVRRLGPMKSLDGIAEPLPGEADDHLLGAAVSRLGPLENLDISTRKSFDHGPESNIAEQLPGEANPLLGDNIRRLLGSMKNPEEISTRKNFTGNPATDIVQPLPAEVNPLFEANVGRLFGTVKHPEEASTRKRFSHRRELDIVEQFAAEVVGSTAGAAPKPMRIHALWPWAWRRRVAPEDSEASCDPLEKEESHATAGPGQGWFKGIVPQTSESSGSNPEGSSSGLTFIAGVPKKQSARGTSAPAMPERRPPPRPAWE